MLVALDGGGEGQTLGVAEHGGALTIKSTLPAAVEDDDVFVLGGSTAPDCSCSLESGSSGTGSLLLLGLIWLGTRRRRSWRAQDS